MFHRIKLRLKAANVALVNLEKVGEVTRTPLRVIVWDGVRFGDFSGPLPRWGL